MRGAHVAASRLGTLPGALGSGMGRAAAARTALTLPRVRHDGLLCQSHAGCAPHPHPPSWRKRWSCSCLRGGRGRRCASSTSGSATRQSPPPATPHAVGAGTALAAAAAAAAALPLRGPPHVNFRRAIVAAQPAPRVAVQHAATACRLHLTASLAQPHPATPRLAPTCRRRGGGGDQPRQRGGGGHGQHAGPRWAPPPARCPPPCCGSCLRMPAQALKPARRCSAAGSCPAAVPLPSPSRPFATPHPHVLLPAPRCAACRGPARGGGL